MTDPKALTEEQILRDHPRMGPEDRFQFRCDSTLDCFTHCCRDVSIVLTPYDIVRMKRALGIDSSEFLEKHTISPFTPEQKFPIVLLRMDPETRRCPFVGEQGCGIYANRPWACRMYPLGVAAPRNPTPEDRAFHFLVREDLCHGHDQEAGGTAPGDLCHGQGAGGTARAGHGHDQGAESTAPEDLCHGHGQEAGGMAPEDLCHGQEAGGTAPEDLCHGQGAGGTAREDLCHDQEAGGTARAGHGHDQGAESTAPEDLCHGHGQGAGGTARAGHGHDQGAGGTAPENLCHGQEAGGTARAGHGHDQGAESTAPENLCHGQEAGCTVREWSASQGIEEYDMMGASFRELTIHPFWDGDKALTPPQMDMFHMACYDLDRFRRFVFETRFLTLLEIDESRLQALRTDDLELLEFAAQWLRFSLFQEQTMRIRKPVLEARRK